MQCAKCGASLSATSPTCGTCGASTGNFGFQAKSPAQGIVDLRQVSRVRPKDRQVALIFAIFFGVWTWMYTWERDARKFLWGLAIHIVVALIMVAAIVNHMHSSAVNCNFGGDCQPLLHDGGLVALLILLTVVNVIIWISAITDVTRKDARFCDEEYPRP
jgi:hypothetical protein